MDGDCSGGDVRCVTEPVREQCHHVLSLEAQPNFPQRLKKAVRRRFGEG